MVEYSQIVNLLRSHNIEALVCGGTARDIYLKRKPVSNDIAVNVDFQSLNTILKSDQRITIVKQGEHPSIEIVYLNKNYILYPLKRVTVSNTYYSYTYTKLFSEDAESRDFTINSIYFDPISNSWSDFNTGLQDLENKVIRFVGNPESTLFASKIRILRAFVLKSILGDQWKIDAITAQCIKQHKLKLIPVSARQINGELIKVLTRSETPSVFFRILRRFGVLEDFFPELHKCIDIEQNNKSEALDLFDHIMYAIDSIPVSNSNALLLRTAALLHDIGKPYTEVVTSTGLHFYNHENVGSYLSDRILYRFGFQKDFVEQVHLLIQHHLFEVNKDSDASLKRLINKVGPENIHHLLDLRIADRYGTGRHDISMININLIRDAVNRILDESYPEHFKLNIEDSELIQLVGEEALDSVKEFIKSKITSGRLINKSKNIIKAVKKINKIYCPLGKAHLFKTWTELQNGSADVFENGQLKCGVYCNFTCNNPL